MRLFPLPLFAALLIAACNGDPSDKDGDTDVTDTDDTVEDDEEDNEDDDDDDLPDQLPSTVPTVECDNTASPLPEPDRGICGVVTGSGGSGLSIEGIILAPDAVYDGGAVVLDADGDITCVGCECAHRPRWPSASCVQTAWSAQA